MLILPYSLDASARSACRNQPDTYRCTDRKFPDRPVRDDAILVNGFRGIDNLPEWKLARAALIAAVSAERFEPRIYQENDGVSLVSCHASRPAAADFQNPGSAPTVFCGQREGVV